MNSKNHFFSGLGGRMDGCSRLEVHFTPLQLLLTFYSGDC